MTERGDTDMSRVRRGSRRYTRYCLREGHLFGGLTAGVLISLNVGLFLVWAIAMLALWAWSLFGGDADAD